MSIERVVHSILVKQEELRGEPFKAVAPPEDVFVRNFWRIRGLQDALEIINGILREDVDRES